MEYLRISAELTLPIFERQLTTALGLSNAQQGPTEKRVLYVAPVKGKERMGEKVREYAEVVSDHAVWPFASQVQSETFETCGAIRVIRVIRVIIPLRIYSPG